MDDDTLQEFEHWIRTRPPIIQDLARKYPYYKRYRISQGAPYAITYPGTVVEIESYRESGEIVVSVRPENMQQITKAHILDLCLTHDRPLLMLYEAIACAIDPCYLEQIDENQ